MNLYTVLDRLKRIAETYEKTDLSAAIKSAKITNPFANALTEDDNAQQNADHILKKIADSESIDSVYAIYSDAPSNEAEEIAKDTINKLYDDVVIDTGLDPDDDHEQICDVVVDRLIEKYGTESVTEGVENNAFQSLWDTYVPRSGKADTAFGEAIRAIGRFEYEYSNNGFENAKPHYRNDSGGYTIPDDDDDDLWAGYTDEESNNEFDEFYQEIFDTLTNFVRQNGGGPAEMQALEIIKEQPPIYSSSGAKTFDNAIAVLKDFVVSLQPQTEAGDRTLGIHSDVIGETQHSEYNAFINLNEGKEMTFSKNLNEGINLTVNNDSSININAEQGSAQDEANSIATILRNAGITPSPVSPKEPMGMGPVSTGYEPIAIDEPINSPADSTADPEMNVPDYSDEPDDSMNAPDYSDGIDDFGVDYAIDTDDGFEGSDDPEIDVVTDPVEDEFDEAAVDHMVKSSDMAKMAYDAGQDLARNGGHISDVNVSDSWGPHSTDFTQGYQDALSLKESKECPSCGGSGTYYDDETQTEKECPDCAGAGEYDDYGEKINDITKLSGQKSLDEWANTPNGNNDERGDYQDTEYMVNTLSGGPNKPKANGNPANKGDNPMAKTTKMKVEESARKIEDELTRAFGAYK